jgi:hypothetical protein
VVFFVRSCYTEDEDEDEDEDENETEMVGCGRSPR